MFTEAEQNHIFYNLLSKQMLSCDQIKELLSDKYKTIHTTIAKIAPIELECQCDVFSALSKSKYMNVREGIAGRRVPKKCACEVYNGLADDTSSDVLAVLAQNRTIPDKCVCDILRKLLKSGNRDIFWNVIENPNFQKCAD